MPKLLQINVCANWGSTGKIVEQIGEKAIAAGWESYVYYGDYANASKSHLIKSIARFPFMYEHYLECNLLDREGLASRIPTYNLVRHIKRMSPDVIHLHNIHDHWINYPILFKHLVKANIPIVWTFHDMWAITGHCYINYGDCPRWKTECARCPHKNRFGPDCSKYNYNLKKKYFSSVKNLSIVTVSEWLGGIVSQSFLSDKSLTVIPNGVDVDTFSPQETDIKKIFNIYDKYLIVGVAQVWDDRKNLDAYFRLREKLSDEYVILLVGLKPSQIQMLPNGIIGVEKTKSVFDLSAIYNAANVTLSLSKAETFGLTIAESMACGTPVVVYGNTAQQEVVRDGTGYAVEDGNIDAVKERIELICKNGKSAYTPKCLATARSQYDKDKNFNEYISLYNKLLDIVMGGVK